METISSNNTKMEKSLFEILHIVYRRKIIIILSVFVSLILAYLYNKFSTPVFESRALLKKEIIRGDENRQLRELLSLSTMDQIGTEIELIKTEDVLSRVIDKLELRVKLIKIINPIGNSYELNNVFIVFPDSGNSYDKQIGFSLPIFKNVELENNRTDQELYIVKKGEKLFELREVKGNKLLLISNTSQVNQIDTSEDFSSATNIDSTTTLYDNTKGSIFNTDFARFEFYWNDAPIGSKIYFNIINYPNCLKQFSSNMYVTGGTSNLFALNVRSSTPFAAKVIATNIVNSFIEARMEQQQQTVSYSFKFVDEQLTEIQKKLLDAESKLSDFKATGEMMSISSATNELVGYLSTLEAEKINTDILLTDYRNKTDALIKQLKSSPYFDQGFLEPTGEFQASSPFTQLMGHLTDLQLQRLVLLQKRTENHPDVVAVDREIQATEEKLTSYNQHTLTSYRIITNNLEKKLVKISTLMSTYEDKLHQLPESENKLTRLEREKDTYERIFKLLLDKREEMRVAELSKLQDIVVVDPPHESIKPIKPNKFMNMLIALFLGGFIGIIIIFLVELRNTKLIDVNHIEEEYKIPVLALIPNYSKNIVKRIKNQEDYKDRFVALKGDNLGIRESYRLLKTKLLQQGIREKIILVTSCEENTGKTSIVANIAITMAREDKKVLIIDCDLRKADLSNMFDLSLNSPGLIDYFTRGVLPKAYTKVLKKLDIIPAGGTREDSSSLLSSDRMESFIDAMDKSVYDYIIIDTPPITRVVDTLVLGQYVKNAILIVRPNISIKETVFGGMQEMRQARIKILGIVANAIEIQSSYYYRYRYGYGYGYSYEKSNNENGRFINKINFGKRDRSKVHKLSKIGHS